MICSGTEVKDPSTRTTLISVYLTEGNTSESRRIEI